MINMHELLITNSNKLLELGGMILDGNNLDKAEKAIKLYEQTLSLFQQTLKMIDIIYLDTEGIKINE